MERIKKKPIRGLGRDLNTHSIILKQGMLGEGIFSPCEKYRYTLWRGEGGETERFCMFIGLNPSTADQDKNDPTVARCWKWAQEWGFKSFVMTNAFAFRATDPQAMKVEPDPVGRDNDAFLFYLARRAGRLVCAWGNHGHHMGRGKSILGTLRRMSSASPLCFGKEVECFGQTKHRFPLNPLYLKQSTRLRSVWL